jgi:hypothetical protein
MNQPSNNSENAVRRKNNAEPSQVSKEDKSVKEKRRLVLFSIVFGVVGFYCGIASCMIGWLWEVAGFVLAALILCLTVLTIILAFKLKSHILASFTQSQTGR